MTRVVGVTAWPTTTVGENAPIPVQAVSEDCFAMLDWVGLGGMMIPNLASSGHLDEAVNRIDGLLLTGGGDVAPARYGAAQRSQTTGVNPRRDEVESKLVRLACQRGLPILAICRGIQLLNVALGGTLVQDLPTSNPPRPGHMSLETPNGPAHRIQLEPGTLLHRLLGHELTVNSLHHQAVERLAPRLRVAARAPDGVIEAIEDDDARFVVGLQWHPEMLGPNHPSMAILREFAVATAKAST